MMTNWLTSPLAEALGWTLIHALWQGFVVVLTTATVLHLLRRDRASLRYTVGLSGLLMQFLASVVTFLWYYESHSLVVSAATASRPMATVSEQVIAPGQASWLGSAQVFLATHLTQIVWLWLMGVSVFGLRLVGGWLYVQRLRHTAPLPVPPVLLDVTARLAQQLNVSVRLQATARVVGPLVVGVLKPVVLWPVGLLAGLSAAEVEAVLAHELAHVRRHDYGLNVVQSVVDVLYFFHPALWWLSARVREEREHCCDDLAVAIIGDARVLARALARVETWQHEMSTAPALAMAFASKRQLLLQRVRRMLGVPTRPLVSNGSLAGLTLATVLLLSVSVYAVQRADDPKPARSTPNQVPPKANRRYRVDANSEYGTTNSGQLSYVIWKGQKLPATRVAKLQRQLDLVMGGKLNLDVVKQPDRDMLLTIIEKNVAFDAGMKALSDGMARINYTNVNTDVNTEVQANVPDSLEKPVVEVIDSVKVGKEWAKLAHYYQSMDGSDPVPASDTSQLRAVKLKMEALTSEMQKVMTERQPLADQLSKEMVELAQKNKGLPQQAGQFSKQQAILAKQQAVLARQQVLLAQKLHPLSLDIDRLSRQNTTQANQLRKQKELQRAQLEKQMGDLGTRMGKLGGRMGDLGQQLQPLESVETRIGILADSISKLYEPTYALSDELAKLSQQLAEQAEKQHAEAMRMAEEAVSGMRVTEGDVVHSRPARAPRPMRLARPPHPPRPAVAPKAPRPAVDAVPAIAPVPETAPKPAIAPVPKVPKPPKD